MCPNSFYFRFPPFPIYYRMTLTQARKHLCSLIKKVHKEMNNVTLIMHNEVYRIEIQP